MKNIGVLTSGGDSPGMNACIRAVVRGAVAQGLEVFGIYHGYSGLIQGDIKPLNTESVAQIIHRGGTILKTARCKEFFNFEGRKLAFEQLKKHQLEGLIVIGGDGTFTGAKIFSSEYNIPIIGLPGTIDNDLFGTDYTIGYDTALNTVVESVDKIRDTAESHNRLFVVEVMGKDAGFIALRGGIATGAEAILVPETETNLEQLIEHLKFSRRKNKTSGIILVAEGDDSGGGVRVSESLKNALPDFDIRLTILGHVQRGGSPSAFDRVLASRLGVEAVQRLQSGEQGVMLGINGMNVVAIPFEKAIKHHRKLKPDLLNLVNVLAR